MKEIKKMLKYLIIKPQIESLSKVLAEYNNQSALQPTPPVQEFQLERYEELLKALPNVEDIILGEKNVQQKIKD